MAASEVLLVTAGEDVRLWTMPDLTLHSKQVLSGGAQVNECVCSNNGQLIAYVGEHHSIGVSFVHGAGTGNANNTYSIQTSCEQSCIAFSNNSRFIVSGGRDGVLHVWDVKSRAVRRTFQDHINPVTCCTFNFNDKIVASSSDKGEIILTEVSSGSASAPLVGIGTDRINCLGYSFFTHSLLASGDGSGSVSLWDVNDRKLLKSFTDHNLPATSLSFSPLNDMLLCSTGLDKRIIFYDVCYKKIVKTINTDEALTSCDFLHDGTTVAVGSTSGKIYIFDLRHGSSPLKIMQAHQSSIKGVNFQKQAKERAGRPASQEIKSEMKSSNNTPPPRPSSDRSNTSQQSRRSQPAPDTATPRKEMVEKRERNSLHEESLSVGSSKSNSTNSLNVVPPKTAKIETSDVYSPIIESSGRKPVARSKSALKKYDLKNRNSNSSSESGSQPPSMGIRSKSGLGRLSLLSQSTGDLSRSGKRTSTEDLVNAMKTKDAGDNESLKKGLLKFKSPFRKRNTDSASKGTDDSETSSNDSFPMGSEKGSNIRMVTSNTPTLHETSSVNSVQLVQQHNELDTASAASSSLVEPITVHQEPRGDLPIETIQTMIDEAMEDHRASIHKDLCTLQVEFLRQMEIQKEQLRQMMEHYSINDDLVGELSRLRTENERLKKGNY